MSPSPHRSETLDVRGRLAAWWPVALVVSVSVVLSSMSDFSALPGGTSIPSFGAHLVIFGALAAALRRALLREGRTRRDALRHAFWLTVAYGVVDELHQMAVPMRTGSVVDLVTDAAGALLALAAVEWWERRAATRERERAARR